MFEIDVVRELDESLNFVCFGLEQGEQLGQASDEIFAVFELHSSGALLRQSAARKGNQTKLLDHSRIEKQATCE